MSVRAWLDRLAAKSPVVTRSGKPFQLHRYIDAAGQFDYEKYRAVQAATNKRKLDRVWVQEKNIQFLSAYIKRHIPSPALGLCHGVRRGLEQKWFREQLGCAVLGTEISDTATQFPDTIRWDFHEVKPEWRGSVDFIYSNSLDHSYDPERCIAAWTSCLTDRGMLLIEHSTDHEVGRESDPFGAPLHVMPFLLLQWGQGAHCVREILDAPARASSQGREFEVKVLVVRANSAGHPARREA